jgi:UDP-glucose 4-epimerase
VRILVTGGAGFIGSHVVDRLRDAGHEPRIYDTRPSPHHGRETEAVKGDLLDLKALRRAMEGCDAVVHLAAAADVDEVAADPAEAERVNSRGTLNVLEAARTSGLRRVVYGSTIWVYSGNGAVDEDTPLGLPDHLYTATKLAGEMYCRSYAELYGLECTTLRFGIPYGPRARPAAVIPAFVRKALAGEPLTLAGGGEQSRRFVYVEDLADGVVRALCPEAAGRTYNLVSTKDVSIRQVAETVQELVGDVEVVSTARRAGDFGGVEVSGERAARELNWRASTPFEEGVRRYLHWHREAERSEEPIRARVLERLGQVALTGVGAVGLVVGVLSLLGAFLVTAHYEGARTAEAGSVLTTSLLGVALYMLLGLDWVSRRRPVVFACWAGAALYVLTLVIPEFRAAVHINEPDTTPWLLGVAAGGFGVALATGERSPRPNRREAEEAAEDSST